MAELVLKGVIGGPPMVEPVLMAPGEEQLVVMGQLVAELVLLVGVGEQHVVLAVFEAVAVVTPPWLMWVSRVLVA